VATRHLIVTADDFGLDLAINEAVERAFTDGVLTAASLMVGQPAAADAAERARRLPGLRVGLHVTLTGGMRPVLPAQQLPDLVDAQGRLPQDLAGLGWRLATHSRTRRQAADEIRAQFDAFARTGLTLDHANAHQHYHMHPFVLDRIVTIGRSFGLRAVRVPFEPLWLARAVAASAPRAGRLPALGWAVGAHWIRRRLRREGLAGNDYLFGLRCTGEVNEAALCEALEQLRPGIAEVYLHPATRSGASEQSAGVGAHATEEFDALMSAAALDRLRRLRASVGGFQDIASAVSTPQRWVAE
jgi:hopanoid biosynthesis associated protein HpnK